MTVVDTTLYKRKREKNEIMLCVDLKMRFFHDFPRRYFSSGWIAINFEFFDTLNAGKLFKSFLN